MRCQASSLLVRMRPEHTSTGAIRPIARQPRSRVARLLYGLAGGLALLLGVLGIFLPGLPTTPFVLLAAACFAKASPRVHRWMLQHRLLGPVLRNWERHRSLTRGTKYVAVGTMMLTISFSVWAFSDRPWVQAALLLLGGIGALVVLRIPTRADVKTPRRQLK